MTNKFYGYYNSPIGILEIIASEDAIISTMFVEEIGESSGETEILRKLSNNFMNTLMG